MPFHFKMQKVLDYREQLEEEAKVNLAIQRARLAEAQDRLDKIKSELRQAEDRLVGAVLMDAAERWVLEQYVKGLRADAAHEALQVRMLEQLAEEARQLLAEPLYNHRQELIGCLLLILPDCAPRELASRISLKLNSKP